MFNLVELALRIKLARKEQKLTLDELAARSDLGKGLLSKVENFRVTPSLHTLAKICHALNISMEKLFEGIDNEPNMCLLREGNGREIERDAGESSIRYFDLAHSCQNRTMDPFELIIGPGCGRDKSKSHEGEEFLRVLKGKVHFTIANEVHVLSEGDSIYFNARIPHCVNNPFKVEARLLCVFRESDQLPEISKN